MEFYTTTYLSNLTKFVPFGFIYAGIGRVRAIIPLSPILNLMDTLGDIIIFDATTLL